MKLYAAFALVAGFALPATAFPHPHPHPHPDNNIDAHSAASPPPDCSICDAYKAACTCDCTHEDRYCLLGCRMKLCLEGPATCRGNTTCGLSNHCNGVVGDLVPDPASSANPTTPTTVSRLLWEDYGPTYAPPPLPPVEAAVTAETAVTPLPAAVFSTTTATKSLASEAPMPAPTEVVPSDDPCQPCLDFFWECINTCPVKNHLGCVDVCKFKTCNLAPQSCPASCNLGYGATLGCRKDSEELL